jgi:hypothetical protein
MYILIFILCLVPSFASAAWSHIRFTVLNEGAKGIEQKYDVVLHDSDSKLDRIMRENADGTWKAVFQGAVDLVELPEDARIDEIAGACPRLKEVLSNGVYTLDDDRKSVGVIVQSGATMAFLTPFGTPQIAWPGGTILEAVQLDRDFEMTTGRSFYIFSVRGTRSGSTYIMIDGESKNTHRLIDSFRDQSLQAHLEDGIIHLKALRRDIDPDQLEKDLKWMEVGRERAKRVRSRLDALFREPTKAEILDELIALLDDREPLESMDNAGALAKTAIRGMMMREFPRLLELEKTDGAVRDHVERLVNSLAQLWLGRKAVSGELIHNTLIQRLEAAMENRANCELSLLSVKGPGSHALSYYKSEALRSLNALHRKLYRK